MKVVERKNPASYHKPMEEYLEGIDRTKRAKDVVKRENSRIFAKVLP
jgi:hypothetical protein